MPEQTDHLVPEPSDDASKPVNLEALRSYTGITVAERDRIRTARIDYLEARGPLREEAEDVELKALLGLELVADLSDDTGPMDAKAKAARKALDEAVADLGRLRAEQALERDPDEPIDPMPLSELLEALGSTRRELEAATPGSHHHRVLEANAASLDARVKAAKAAADAAELEAQRNPAPEPVPELPTDTVSDESLRMVLELNGFMGLRNGILGAVQAVAGLAPEDVSAAIAYNATATARLRLMPDEAQAAKAIRAAERHAAYFEQVARWRKDLKALEERLEARERLSVVR
jgi:hypothetical protein